MSMSVVFQNSDQDVKGTKPITAQFEKYQVNVTILFQEVNVTILFQDKACGAGNLKPLKLLFLNLFLFLFR